MKSSSKYVSWDSLRLFLEFFLGFSSGFLWELFLSLFKNSSIDFRDFSWSFSRDFSPNISRNSVRVCLRYFFLGIPSGAHSEIILSILRKVLSRSAAVFFFDDFIPDFFRNVLLDSGILEYFPLFFLDFFQRFLQALLQMFFKEILSSISIGISS